MRGGATVDSVAGSTGWTSLHLASFDGNADSVRVLLIGGAQVGAVVASNGATALHMASRGGAHMVASLLLDGGASVGARDRQGNTPGMLAKQQGHESTRELLQLHEDAISI